MPFRGRYPLSSYLAGDFVFRALGGLLRPASISVGATVNPRALESLIFLIYGAPLIYKVCTGSWLLVQRRLGDRDWAELNEVALERFLPRLIIVSLLASVFVKGPFDFIIVPLTLASILFSLVLYMDGMLFLTSRAFMGSLVVLTERVAMVICVALLWVSETAFVLSYALSMSAALVFAACVKGNLQLASHYSRPVLWRPASIKSWPSDLRQGAFELIFLASMSVPAILASQQAEETARQLFLYSLCGAGFLFVRSAVIVPLLPKILEISTSPGNKASDVFVPLGAATASVLVVTAEWASGRSFDLMSFGSVTFGLGVILAYLISSITTYAYAGGQSAFSVLCVGISVACIMAVTFFYELYICLLGLPVVFYGVALWIIARRTSP